MRVPWQFDPRIAAELRPHRRDIQLGLLLTGVAASLYSLTVFLVKHATNAVAKLAERGPFDEAKRLAADRLGWLCLAVVALFSVRYLLVRGQQIALGRAGSQLTADLRQRLMAKLLRL
ncbi:MAG: hypothetical protein C4320_07935, partial [Armatimonadota bacterium]